MAKYTITIEETVTEDFEIEASSEEEAARIAEEQYKAGELVLEPGNLVAANLSTDGGDSWMSILC